MPDFTVFYSLLAQHLSEGMSTDDGLDILEVTIESEGIDVRLYAPYLGESDSANAPLTRHFDHDQRVQLAVFPDTAVDGTHYRTAQHEAP